MATKKAQVIASQLAGKLKLRLPVLAAVSMVESVDTDGNPTVRIGAASAGLEGALVRVISLSWPTAKDVLGLAANIFVPHVIQICREAATNTWATDMAFIAECLAQGARVELYECDDGEAVAVSEIVAGNLKATIDPDLQYGIVANS